MPTAAGKLQLQDYDDALVAEGFDGFNQDIRLQAINLGYRYIVRAFPFLWEVTSQSYTINPGNSGIVISGVGTPGTPNMIREVYLTTDPYRRKLRPLSEDEFMRRWFYQDLTSAQVQGTPDAYYFWNGEIYILPPPNLTMTFLVWFNQFLSDMVNLTDTPVTPQIYDEAVLDAARVRMHRHAKELTLAAEAQTRVDQALGDMLQDDAFGNWDLEDRVRPDDQWL